MPGIDAAHRNTDLHLFRVASSRAVAEDTELDITERGESPQGRRGRKSARHIENLQPREDTPHIEHDSYESGNLYDSETEGDANVPDEDWLRRDTDLPVDKNAWVGEVILTAIDFHPTRKARIMDEGTLITRGQNWRNYNRARIVDLYVAPGQEDVRKFAFILSRNSFFPRKM